MALDDCRDRGREHTSESVVWEGAVESVSGVARTPAPGDAGIALVGGAETSSAGDEVRSMVERRLDRVPFDDNPPTDSSADAYISEPSSSKIEEGWDVESSGARVCGESIGTRMGEIVDICEERTSEVLAIDVGASGRIGVSGVHLIFFEVPSLEESDLRLEDV